MALEEGHITTLIGDARHAVDVAAHIGVGYSARRSLGSLPATAVLVVTGPAAEQVHGILDGVADIVREMEVARRKTT